MKFFAFIMAVLVMFLNGIPCADTEPLQEIAATIISQPFTDNCNPFNDLCSPFCQCSCGAGFSIGQPIVVSTLVNSTCDQYSSSYLASSALDVSLAIWQPPKINS